MGSTSLDYMDFHVFFLYIKVQVKSNTLFLSSGLREIFTMPGSYVTVSSRDKHLKRVSG